MGHPPLQGGVQGQASVRRHPATCTLRPRNEPMRKSPTKFVSPPLKEVPRTLVRWTREVTWLAAGCVQPQGISWHRAGWAWSWGDPGGGLAGPLSARGRGSAAGPGADGSVTASPCLPLGLQMTPRARTRTRSCQRSQGSSLAPTAVDRPLREAGHQEFWLLPADPGASRAVPALAPALAQASCTGTPWGLGVLLCTMGPPDSNSTWLPCFMGKE